MASKRPGRKRLSLAEKARRAARPHETAGEVALRLCRYGASFGDTARYLEERGYRTPGGRLRWSVRAVYFEYFKARVAKGTSKGGRRYEDNMNRQIIEADKAGDESRVQYLIAIDKANRGLAAMGASYRHTYPLRTTAKTQRDRALQEWWKASEAARLRGEPGPPEPLFDSRGRPLKGRKLSRVKRPAAPV